MGVSYLTIAHDAEAEIEVRRSRFRCTLQRVTEEAGARGLVERLRREHWDARHHCSAFRIQQGTPGPVGRPALGQPVERSSDDGEPPGTAGAPMLEVLRGAEVGDVVAVVTRWFGGTLLGAGGLVRAYGDAVRAGLAEAGTLRRELLHEFTTEVEYDAAGRLETDLRAQGYAVLEVSYGASVMLRLGASVDEAGRLGGVLAGLTAGAAILTPAGERWVDRS